MNIPIEIIVLVLTLFFSIIGTLFGIALNVVNKNTQAMETLKDIVNDVQKRMSIKDTEDKYESAKCEATHGYITNKLKEHTLKLENHESRINKVENEKPK